MKHVDIGSLALASVLAAVGCYGSYQGSTTDAGTASAPDDGGATTDDAATSEPPTNDEFDTPVTCTSGTTWKGGDRGASTMQPGNTCIACHSQGEGPSFLVAGTVYPSAHEPNECNGKSGVKVVITDSANNVFTLTTNSAGNFACGKRAQQGFPACAAFKPPYSAKVVVNGVERAMSATQTTGDCNGCHTESGANDAPGRIMAP